MNNASQCLHFWLTVESYRSLNFLDGKTQNLLDDINSIYMRFFFFVLFFSSFFLFSFFLTLLLETPRRFLVDEDLKRRLKPELVEKVRLLLERQENPEVIFDTLFSLQKEIYHVMESTYLKPFLESELFWELQKDIPNLKEDYFDVVYSSEKGKGKDSGDTTQPLSEGGKGPNPASSVPPFAAVQTRHRPGVLFTAELKDVLVNSTALYYFMQFAERHVEVKNMINFYLTVERWFFFPLFPPFLFFFFFLFCRIGLNFFFFFFFSSFFFFCVSSYFNYGSQKGQDDDEILRQDAKQMFNLHFAPDAPQPIRLGAKYVSFLFFFFFFFSSSCLSSPQADCSLAVLGCSNTFKCTWKRRSTTEPCPPLSASFVPKERFVCFLSLFLISLRLSPISRPLRSHTRFTRTCPRSTSRSIWRASTIKTTETRC